MSIVSLVLSLIAVFFSSVTFAAGETVPCMERKVGDSYISAKTDFYGKRTVFAMKVVRLEENNQFSIVNQDGQAMITDGMFNIIKAPDGRVFTPKYYSRMECPFTLGETKTYRDVKYRGIVNGSEMNGTFTVTVSPEFTTITVPAGTFKVVKMISKNDYTWKNPFGSGDGHAETVSYYSPELGAIIKSEISDKPSRGDVVKDKFELTEYLVGK